MPSAMAAPRPPPAISLPKGGGAIRGMGEKFAANPVTGTGSMTVPIATSPGRSGFGPQLSLSYDSGAGNGPFGFGWSLSLPSITRKTDKGLPRYRDAEESDVFILSGAEDLVPVLKRSTGAGSATSFHAVGTEALPRPSLPPAHRGAVRPHRALDRAGATATCTGARSPGTTSPRSTARPTRARIADPADPTRVFSWLICESYDDKGNADRLRVQAGGRRTASICRQAHERNRTDRRPAAANRYLKRIRYGNRTPLLTTPERTDLIATARIRLDVRGRLRLRRARRRTSRQPTTIVDDDRDSGLPPRPVLVLPRRLRGAHLPPLPAVLMFHHFPDELGVGTDCLVRSTDFTYPTSKTRTIARNPIYIVPARPSPRRGYKRRTDGGVSEEVAAAARVRVQPGHRPGRGAGGRRREPGEPARMASTARATSGSTWTARASPASSPSRPGLVLQAQPQPDQREPATVRRRSTRGSRPSSWSPQSPPSPWSGGQAAVPRPRRRRPARPGAAGRPDARLLRAHGRRRLGAVHAPSARCLTCDWHDPNLRFVDLDRRRPRRRPDHRGRRLRLVPVAGRGGLRPGRDSVRQALDEEKGPRLVFADGTQSIYLADMSRRRADRPGADPQRRGLLLAEPRLRPLRRQGDDGRRALVRRTRPVRPAAHPAGRHRRLRHHRHHLPAAATACACTSTSPATAGASRSA